MPQQINLYQYLPKKKRIWLTPKVVLFSYGSFMLLLILMHLLFFWQGVRINKQYAALTLTVNIRQQQLMTLVQKHPYTDLNALKREIAKLQEEHVRSIKQLDLLSPDANFSTYMIGLGNAIIPGIWLTQITFDSGEEKIMLRGYALAPSLLTHFYNQLTKQPQFINLSFKINEIKQTAFPANFVITAKTG